MTRYLPLGCLDRGVKGKPEAVQGSLPHHIGQAAVGIGGNQWVVNKRWDIKKATTIQI